jgi:hypothetical protein
MLQDDHLASKVFVFGGLLFKILMGLLLFILSLVKKECEKRTNTVIASNTSDAVDAQIAVDETISIQTDLPPGSGENQTIHRERPRVFKFGEALFRLAAGFEKLPAE